MHEFSLCQNLVESVLTELENLDQPPQTVSSVTVVVGRLRQIIPDYFEFAYQTLSQNTILEGSKLKITQLPITLKCQKCHTEQSVDAPKFTCSNCGSNQLETLSGMELYLDSIEVEH